MANEILMPKLGFDMAEGTLVRWLADVGSTVEKGAVLAEIETDKATLELEASTGGTLLATFADPGAILPVGVLIGMVGEAGEKIDLAALQARAASEQGLEAPAEAPAEAPTPATPAPSAPAPSAPKEAAAPAPTPTPAAVVEADGNLPEGVRASPLARNIAKEQGIDLRQVAGSGPRGRVVKQDVLAAGQGAPAAPVAQPTAATATVATPDLPAPSDEVVPLTRLRQAIGRRMVESKTTIPHFQVTTAIDMSAAMALRQQLNAALADDGVKLSVNDLIVKAAALTLRKFPNLNAKIDGNQLIRKGQINIGIAVAVPGGLLTIVARDADRRSLADISVNIKAMGARARDGRVQPTDIEGSTFTTSNLGMFNVDAFTAIINPGEVAILATGSVVETPVVKDGQIVVGQQMKATLSADHRATDGAEAAQYMQALKQLLENPLRLLV